VAKIIYRLKKYLITAKALSTHTCKTNITFIQQLLLTAKFKNMRYLPFLCLQILFFASVFSVCAQVPQLINYQAVLRDALGQPLPNQAVLVRLAIHQSSATGTIQYQEIHTVTSNAQASINFQIGAGAIVTGIFSNITWADGQPKFLEIELDPDGAGPQSFINIGAQQLVSVPYSVYSDNTKLVKTNNDNLSVGLTNYNLTGAYNTAAGTNVLTYNTTGNSNTANGYRALFYNTTGDQNTANGTQALYNTTTGYYNTAIGSNALYSNTTGYGNTANGIGSLYLNTTGTHNTAIGTSTLFTNSTGHSNVAIGSYALFNNTNQSNNVAIGDSALYNNGLWVYQDNHAIYNTAIGSKALLNNNHGFKNSAVGFHALRSNTEGYSNTAIGFEALVLNNTGNFNTSIGSYALSLNNNGNGNTAIGSSALGNQYSGQFNTGIGYNAGVGISDGSWNTCIGDRSDVSYSNLNGASSLGTQAITNADNKIVLGYITGMTIGGYANWSNLSDGRFKQNVQGNVPGLSFIEQLRPVTYTVDIDKLQHHITAQMPDSIAPKYYPTPEQITAANAEIRTGFIAQEVEAAAQKIGYNFDGINPPKNPTDNYSLEYAGFVPSMVKAIQEQQNMIEKQNETIEQLQNELQQIKSAMYKSK